MKTIQTLLLAFTVTLSAQELLPEIASKAQKHRAETAALTEQRTVALARIQQAYFLSLTSAEKAALDAVQFPAVAAVTKEREDVIAGKIAPAAPVDLPKSLHSARKSFVDSAARVTTEYVPRQQRIDAGYLRQLANLQPKPNSPLSAQIAAEKQRVLSGLEPAPSSISPNNLLVNGDFTLKGAEGGPASWGMHAENVAIESEGGNPLLRFSKGYCRQGVPVPEGTKSLSMTARVRCRDFKKRPGNPDDFYQMFVEVKMPDGGWVTLCSDVLAAPERGWRKITAAQKVPKGVSELKATLQITGLGTLEVDDVALEIR